MSLNNQISISVTDATPVVSELDFTTTVFADAHRWFKERYRTYSNIEAVVADGIPTSSKAYAGALSFFTANSKAQQSQLILARMDTVPSITPSVTVATGLTFSLVVGVAGSSVTATYTTSSGNTSQQIVDAFITQINANTAVAAKVTPARVGSGAGSALTLTPVSANDQFEVKSLTNLTAVASGLNSAETFIGQLEAETTDWTLIGASDHTATFVADMAEQIEARHKQYIVWTQEAGSLASWNGITVPTDILGLLTSNLRSKTITGWHHQADTIFPEMAVAGRYMGYETGTYSWQYKEIGVPIARNPTTLLPLSETERTNLQSRNADTTIKFGGVIVNGNFTTATGKRIELVRGGEFLATKLKEANELVFLTKGKIAFDDTGISVFKNVHASTWNRYRSVPSKPHLLDNSNPFLLEYPKSADVLYADKSAGVLRASSTAYFAGEIGSVVISVTTSYFLNAGA